jgi:hypothetical protein
MGAIAKGLPILEGRTVGSPSAVSWGDKRLGVFVGQADVAELMVSQEELVAGVWIGWHALGGRMLGDVWCRVLPRSIRS